MVPRWSQKLRKILKQKFKIQFILPIFALKFIEMIALGGGLEGSLGGLGGSLAGLGGSWGAFWKVCGAT